MIIFNLCYIINAKLFKKLTTIKNYHTNTDNVHTSYDQVT